MKPDLTDEEWDRLFMKLEDPIFKRLMSSFQKSLEDSQNVQNQLLPKMNTSQRKDLDRLLPMCKQCGHNIRSHWNDKSPMNYPTDCMTAGCECAEFVHKASEVEDVS